MSLHRPSAAGVQSLGAVLAGFGHDLDLSRVPPGVVEHTKLLLLDTLGAALAGVGTAEGEAIMAALPQFAAATGPCTVWGTPVRTTRAAAALANGTLAHAQELDDFGGCDHSGAVVIPAVLAASERTGVSGARVLEAIIVGYDIALRVLEAVGGYRAHNDRGWHSTGTCGSFGAAAGVAKVLGLGVPETVSAIGLAGSFTGGTWAFLADGAMSKRYHPGRAAEIGVTSGFLAQAGFTGPSRVLEAEWGGFLATYAPDDRHPEKLVDWLGADFKIMRSGVKPYACCRAIHSTLDAILALRARDIPSAEDVRRVVVRCTPNVAAMVGNPDPRTRLAAQMSLPYSVAVALLTGRASLDEYQDVRLSDPAIRALAARVEVVIDPALAKDAEPRVTVTVRTGQTVTRQVPFAKGAPENPLSREEVVAKYTGLASRVLSASAVSRLHGAVLSIEQAASLDALFGALRVRSHRAPRSRRAAEGVRSAARVNTRGGGVGREGPAETLRGPEPTS
jgi:2-methylcitrate dehydratase PrpD